MPQPTGQVDSTSTIENPSPSSWTSNARLIAAFGLADESGVADRHAGGVRDPGSSESISVTGSG